MSSGNILTVTDVLNFLVSGIHKITLEAELTASGWIFTPARGGSKSGAGTISDKPKHSIQCQNYDSTYWFILCSCLQWPRRRRTRRTTPKTHQENPEVVETPTLFCLPKPIYSSDYETLKKFGNNTILPNQNCYQWGGNFPMIMSSISTTMATIQLIYLSK